MPIVSVVLPVYNGAKFVGDAIKSIKNQTFEDWELLIVDDGSNDESLEVCKIVSNGDPRIRIYSNEYNIGLAATMNKLVSMAKGEYIAVQEQDDISVAYRLEKEVEILKRDKDIGLVSGIAAWVDDDNRVFNYFPGILKRGLQYPQDKKEMVKYLYVEQCKVVNACCMFRRDVFDKVPLFDEEANMSIDWQFFLHLANHYKIWGVNDVLVYMKRGNHHCSLTKKKKLQFQEGRRCISKIYQEYRYMELSPVNYLLFRKAMATQVTLEARNLGGLQGLLCNFRAVVYWPFSNYAWWSIFDFVKRALRKMVSP